MNSISLFLSQRNYNIKVFYFLFWSNFMPRGFDNWNFCSHWIYTVRRLYNFECLWCTWGATIFGNPQYIATDLWLGWDDFKTNAASYCPVCPTVYSTVCTQMVTSPINGNLAYEVCCLWDFKLIGFPCLSPFGFFGLLFMGSISHFLGGFSAELFNKFT